LSCETISANSATAADTDVAEKYGFVGAFDSGIRKCRGAEDTRAGNGRSGVIEKFSAIQRRGGIAHGSSRGLEKFISSKH
jgi:hypothetical protein